MLRLKYNEVRNAAGIKASNQRRAPPFNGHGNHQPTLIENRGFLKTDFMHSRVVLMSIALKIRNGKLSLHKHKPWLNMSFM